MPFFRPAVLGIFQQISGKGLCLAGFFVAQHPRHHTGNDNINDIEKYKGRSLWISREQAVPLEEDEYYIADLIGMEVCLEDGTHFGQLKDVIETGANDVYVVEDTKGQEVLLPAIHECILDVDVENDRMTIHLMKGLL